jgi:hypothetical protein
MDFDEQPRWEGFGDDPERSRWAIAVAVVIVLVGAGIAAFILSSGGDDKGTTVAVVAAPKRHSPVPAASPPVAPPPRAVRHHRRGGAEPLGPGTEASFNSLAASLPAQVGLAVAPLGSDRIEEFGDLRGGHAWSSIKVPIVVTLMGESGSGGLDAEEQSLARSAITASDNAAAADLFQRLEELHGGLTGASAAVEGALAKAGDLSTVVATAPPPPGAVSTYGQTEWSLGESAQFFRSLGQGCLLESEGTDYVEGLMQEVIPEQRWGLGEAQFPPAWSVAMKGGWGPEGSAEGPYLVRQSGIVRDGTRGVAVTMIAEDESGSYPAGAADLTHIAQWLAKQLLGLGPPAHASCVG